jgi:hypothetical protein
MPLLLTQISRWTPVFRIAATMLVVEAGLGDEYDRDDEEHEWCWQAFKHRTHVPELGTKRHPGGLELCELITSHGC